MLKKVLLSVLVLVFLGNLGIAQNLTKEQKSRFARIEYKIKLVGDAIVGVRADGIESPKVSTKPVKTNAPKNFVQQLCSLCCRKFFCGPIRDERHMCRI